MKKLAYTMAFTSALCLTSCSMNKNIQDMKKSIKGTEKLAQDQSAHAKSVNALTKDMQNVTDSLFKVSERGYIQQRKGQTKSLRATLLNEMKSKRTLEGKLTDAAAYVMAFEFQQWRGEGLDTPQRRTQLFADGLEEFFGTLAEISDQAKREGQIALEAFTADTIASEDGQDQTRIEMMKKFATSSCFQASKASAEEKNQSSELTGPEKELAINNDLRQILASRLISFDGMGTCSLSAQDYYALALALHLVDSQQKEIEAIQKVPAHSFFDLIRHALTDVPKSGVSDIKFKDDYQYISVVHTNFELTLQILEMRHNILSIMALADIRSLSNSQLSDVYEATVLKSTGTVQQALSTRALLKEVIVSENAPVMEIEEFQYFNSLKNWISKAKDQFSDVKELSESFSNSTKTYFEVLKSLET